jgi:hypothetical protein
MPAYGAIAKTRLKSSMNMTLMRHVTCMCDRRCCELSTRAPRIQVRKLFLAAGGQHRKMDVA